MVKKHKVLFLEDSKGIVKLNNKIGNLFVTSDEQIKEGDWVLETLNKVIFQVKAGGNDYTNSTFKKIIATTDSSLGIEKTKDIGIKIKGIEYLPQPSPQFIQAYIEAYNAGLDGKHGKYAIVDVMVEYETNNINNQKLMFHSEHKECFFEDIIDGKFKTIYLKEILKVDKNNFITITKCKESWSREEMEEIHVAVIRQGSLYEGGTFDDEDERLVRLEFNKYFNQYL